MAKDLDIVRREIHRIEQEFWIAERTTVMPNRRVTFAAKRIEIAQAPKFSCHHWWEIEVVKAGWIKAPEAIAIKLDEAYRKWN